MAAYTGTGTGGDNRFTRRAELSIVTPLCPVVCTEDVTGFGIEEEQITGAETHQQFPVLSKSGIPTWDMETWEFTVTGAVDTDLSLSWSEFTDLPEETQRQDFHCVTGWSRFDNEFTGISFPTIAERAGVHDDTVHVLFGSLGGYSTDLPLDECLREEVLFAFELDD